MGELPVKPVLPSTLDEYAGPANEYHHAAQDRAKSAVQYAHAAGVLLNVAKARCNHGSWLSWLEKSFDGSRQTAERYMSVAANYSADTIGKLSSDLSINGALKEIAAKKNGGKSKKTKTTKAKTAEEPVDAELDEGELDEGEKTEDQTLPDEIEGELVDDEVDGEEVDGDEVGDDEQYDPDQTPDGMTDLGWAEPQTDQDKIAGINQEFADLTQKMAGVGQPHSALVNDAEIAEIRTIAIGILNNAKKTAPTVEVPNTLLYDLLTIVKPEQVETSILGKATLKALINELGGEIK